MLLVDVHKCLTCSESTYLLYLNSPKSEIKCEILVIKYIHISFIKVAIAIQKNKTLIRTIILFECLSTKKIQTGAVHSRRSSFQSINTLREDTSLYDFNESV